MGPNRNKYYAGPGLSIYPERIPYHSGPLPLYIHADSKLPALIPICPADCTLKPRQGKALLNSFAGVKRAGDLISVQNTIAAKKAKGAGDVVPQMLSSKDGNRMEATVSF